MDGGLTPDGRERRGGGMAIEEGGIIIFDHSLWDDIIRPFGSEVSPAIYLKNRMKNRLVPAKS